MARSLSTYLNRNVDNEQYYPATHHQQQQQQHQHLHQQPQCNRHKGGVVAFEDERVVGGQHTLARGENGKTIQHQPHHALHHFSSQQQLPSQLRQDYQQQHQQHHLPQQHQHQAANQQYQNINSSTTWLPPANKIANDEIEDYRPKPQAPPQQHHEQQHHHLGQAQPHQNYCSKHTDNSQSLGLQATAAAASANDMYEPGIGAGVGGYMPAKKTYITPFDIPSPPPQPVLNDLKRFSSGQYMPAKAAGPPSNATVAFAPGTGNSSSALSINNSTAIKSYCQCEHNARAKNTATLSTHNHFQQQQQQTPQQQQQQQQLPAHQRPHMTAGITTTAAGNPTATSLTQQQQNQIQQQQPTHHAHAHHHMRHFNDETLTMPRASSLKQTNPTQAHQQQHQQQQHHHHHHHQQQPQYRKIDVFAAVDDDDNDTSPSIKLSHLDYGHNKMLPTRYGKHLANNKQQTQHQHNLPKTTGYSQYNVHNNNSNNNNNSSSSSSNFYHTASSTNVCGNYSHDNSPQDEDNNCRDVPGDGDDVDDRSTNGVTVNGHHNGAGGDGVGGVTGSYDNDSILTEGRHCNLFCEKQGSIYNEDTRQASSSTSYFPSYPRGRSHHLKQLRINSTNRIDDDEPLNKALRGGLLRGGGLSSLSSMDSNIAGESTATAPHSLHHNILRNDSYGSRLANDHSMSASSTLLLDDNETGDESLVTPQRTYIVPLDIPTPPPQPQIPPGLKVCQCENIGNSHTTSNHFNQVNHKHPQHHHHHHLHQHQHQQYPQQPQPTSMAYLTPASSMLLSHTSIESPPMANGGGHHHQQRQQKLGLNYKLAEQHQVQTHPTHHYPQQSPHLSTVSNSNFGQHYYGQQQQQGAGNQHMYPAYNVKQQRNTFHHGMGNKSYMKSLVYSPQKLRKVRIILGIVGGIVIAALLATALYFIINSSSESSDNGTTTPNNGIHLEDILQGKLISHTFNGSWSTGPSVLYKENNAIVELNVKTKQKTRLMLDVPQQYILYEKSADGQLLLLTKNYKKNFRHSYEAEYDIYNISSGQIQPLTIQNQVKPLIMVQWAPVGNALIMNFERNLYYKPTAFAAEIAITDDTNPAILNGIPDWVYEEEVFSSNSAVWFSPDGSQLAFIQFDDSTTRGMNFPIYGEAGDIRFQYPYNRQVAYPKAGSPNPRVKLFTSDLARAAAGNTDHLTEIPRPSALNTESDYIITVVDWLNKTNVLSVWMNRIQNSAHMQIFNGLRRQEIFSLTSKTGWVDFFAAPFKNREGSRIALLLPQPQDDSGDYRHLCLLSTETTRSQPEAITKGKYVVTSILHWDHGSDVIFYTANTEKNPEYLHVYAIRAATGQTAKCLTCNLHKSNGVEQTYYTADFNTANQIIITSMGPNIPMTAVYEWSYADNKVSLTKLMDWENNDSLRAKLKDVDLPTTEIVNIPISSGFDAKVLMQLPPNMDRSGKTKYPMLVDVYGGPDSYSVVNKWMMDWGTYLSSNQSVIYVKIDGRGSGLRGEKLLHSVYLKLGTVEITDQIDVARQLQQKYPFIDAKHTGIWGWSYGGYAAAMALANDEEHVFRCAASIAPVTDWAYYDSIYTERYMGLPTLNEVGYSNSRLSTRAQKLKGKKFLLVHGTLDDNVHYQQAMILAKNLERYDILFKQISYPDEDHALAGVRPHLYHSLDRFFGDCFAQSRMVYRK